MAAEEFIHFIWKHRFYRGTALKTSCGLDLEVVDPGEQNMHAGPDFFNARIRLDGMLWAGNVEIHRYSSDWYKHGHHLDPAYNNVILHVVNNHDSEVANSLGRRILTLLPDYPRQLLKRYQTLKKNEDYLPCSTYIKELPAQKLKQLLKRLQTQRITQKSLRMARFQSTTDGEKEEVLYLALASGFGLPLNSLPFELLAKRVPYDVMMNHRENLFDLEAMFFGQSGLLFPARRLGSYPSSLWERYLELHTELPGDPLPHHLWKFLRLRPGSFPTLRISQFAFTLHQRTPLVDMVLSAASLAEMEQLFRSPANVYWDNHYLFGKCSPPLPKYLGHQSVATLIINVIVPFLYALEKMETASKAGCGAQELLSQMSAESNQVIFNWRKHGIVAQNAMESQALLQLYNNYCKEKLCLDCQMGAEFLLASINETK